MADVGATSINEAFLSVYGQEVLLAYNEASQIKDKCMNRTIANGLSATFPTFTKETAKLHTAGESVFSGTGELGTSIADGKKVISIDKLLFASQFIDDLEEAKAHFDIRSAYSSQTGAAMAMQHDAMLLAHLANGATTTTEVSSTDASVSGSSSFLDSTAKIKEMFNEAAIALDLKDVPAGDRCMIVRPYEYYSILQEDGVLGSDFNSTGDRSKGYQNFYYMGFEVIPMGLMQDFYNRAAATLTGDDAGHETGKGVLNFGGVALSYPTGLNASLMGAVAFHKSAAATVTLKGLSSEVNYVPERFGNLLSTKTGIGVGTLRPDSSVRINLAQA